MEFKTFCPISLGDAIANGKVKVKGEQKEVAVIFDMFDKSNQPKII